VDSATMPNSWSPELEDANGRYPGVGAERGRNELHESAIEPSTRQWIRFRLRQTRISSRK
jgi:hypothetical protein